MNSKIRPEVVRSITRTGRPIEDVVSDYLRYAHLYIGGVNYDREPDDPEYRPMFPLMGGSEGRTIVGVISRDSSGNPDITNCDSDNGYSGLNQVMDWFGRLLSLNNWDYMSPEIDKIRQTSREVEDEFLSGGDLPELE